MSAVGKENILCRGKTDRVKQQVIHSILALNQRAKGEKSDQEVRRIKMLEQLELLTRCCIFYQRPFIDCLSNSRRLLRLSVQHSNHPRTVYSRINVSSRALSLTCLKTLKAFLYVSTAHRRGLNMKL